MPLDNPNKLELARIGPEMTHEETFQALVAALRRQGIRVIKDKEENSENST